MIIFTAHRHRSWSSLSCDTFHVYSQERVVRRPCRVASSSSPFTSSHFGATVLLTCHTAQITMSRTVQMTMQISQLQQFIDCCPHVGYKLQDMFSKGEYDQSRPVLVHRKRSRVHSSHFEQQCWDCGSQRENTIVSWRCSCLRRPATLLNSQCLQFTLQSNSVV